LLAERGVQSYSRIATGGASADSADARADAQQYLAAVAAIPGTPWVVTIDVPHDALLSPVHEFLRRMTLIALIALGGGMLAGYFVSRRISRPLRELTEAAVAVASGNFSHAPRIDRSDELGRLGHAFAAMASEVQGARDELERKVELRTQDLNATLQQLHEAQDALVRREKLALLGQLASGVGQELRNPLGVMTNALHHLKKDLRAEPASVQGYLDIVQQQITLSEKIVGDLLDFAKSKSPMRRPAHLYDIVEAQLARLGASPGIAIQTEMPRDLPQVRVDPIQVGQIILNLLTNAVQAINGGEGGRIMVRASIAGDQVRCEVCDNGVGIAREHLDRIFEPLFTTKARGVGLGLAVSRQLARANNGELTVSSTPGRGTTFRLWLPIATGTPREAREGVASS
jgi:signal transduction histidine kinase